MPMGFYHPLYGLDDYYSEPPTRYCIPASINQAITFLGFCFDLNRAEVCIFRSFSCDQLFLPELRSHQSTIDMDSVTVVHNGGCHCRRVRWRVEAPRSVVAWKCSCSDCSMRGNVHFIVPSQRFELLGDSKEFLTTYTFGTHQAKHTFCTVCGITSFYIPRSNPDGFAVTFRCVDPGTLDHVEIKDFDGKNWESSYSQSGISSCSKSAD